MTTVDKNIIEKNRAKTLKRNQPQLELSFGGTPEVDLADKEESGQNVTEKNSPTTYTIDHILAAIDSTGKYPEPQKLIEQIVIDLESYSVLQGVDPWAMSQLNTLRYEIVEYRFENPFASKKGEINRPQLDVAESFRTRTPPECLYIVLLKVCVLKALLVKSHRSYLCERLARQIRLSCVEDDSRRGLITTQNEIFDDQDIDCQTALYLIFEIARDEVEDDSALNRRHVAFFTAIRDFFQEPLRNKHKKKVNAILRISGIKTDSASFERIKIKLWQLTTDGIAKSNDGQTFRWLQNALMHKPFSTIRFNDLERYELVANLNDLGNSNSLTDRWTALLITLMYSCGKTVREVNQLTFGDDMDLRKDGSIRRRLKRPLDAGIVAAPKLCNPQSDEIRLPLNKLATELIGELGVEQRPFFVLIPMTIAEQTAKIKALLEDWRNFGRYRLSMPRLSAALSSELSIQTRHPSLLYLLSAKSNHAAPTTSYYTAVLHSKLLAVWTDAQNGLSSHE